MLHEMAVNVAHFFSVNSDISFDEDDIEVYAYGTELILASVLETFVILILGIFFGKLLETIAFFTAFIPLRSYAGGYHAKTHIKCFCVALIVYAIFLLIQFITPIYMIQSVLWIIILVSAFPILLFAPVQNPNRPIGNIEHKRFRDLSLALYLIEAVIIIGLSITQLTPYIALGFAIGLLSTSCSIVAAIARDFYCREVK